MIRLLSLMMALIVVASGAQPECLCRVASDGQAPHGANVYVELDQVAMSQLRGEVVGPDESPASNAIVEVYSITSRMATLRHSDITTERDRLMARVTDENGRFCVPELSPGRYFVVAGLQEHGVNKVHVVVTIRPSSKDDKLFLSLPLTMGS